MSSLAFVPAISAKSKNPVVAEVTSILAGVTLLSALAQFAIPLPWTPVPITGQTFGILLMALLWGSRQAGLVSASYLALGSMGLPIFAMGKSGLSFGPSMGYLVGMLLASFAVGFLADRGFTKSFSKSIFAGLFGTVIIYAFGCLGLALFVPKEQIFAAGVLPFLTGDLLKLLAASSIATGVTQIKELKF